MNELNADTEYDGMVSQEGYDHHQDSSDTDLSSNSGLQDPDSKSNDSYLHESDNLSRKDQGSEEEIEHLQVKEETAVTVDDPDAMFNNCMTPWLLKPLMA